MEEGVTAPADVELIGTLPNAAWLRMTLHQGWNRQIKRMGLAVGHPVLKIRRIAYGPVGLGKLEPGRHRLLKPDEVRKICEAAYASGGGRPEMNSRRGYPYGIAGSFYRGGGGAGREKEKKNAPRFFLS